YSSKTNMVKPKNETPIRRRSAPVPEAPPPAAGRRRSPTSKVSSEPAEKPAKPAVRTAGKPVPTLKRAPAAAPPPRAAKPHARRAGRDARRRAGGPAGGRNEASVARGRRSGTRRRRQVRLAPGGRARFRRGALPVPAQLRDQSRARGRARSRVALRLLGRQP